MGFTGKEALRWKVAYIDAFNRMEAALHQPADTQRMELAFSLGRRGRGAGAPHGVQCGDAG